MSGPPVISARSRYDLGPFPSQLRKYPQLTSLLRANPIPPKGNLFIVKYGAAVKARRGACSAHEPGSHSEIAPRGGRADGGAWARRAGLTLHKDDTALTFNVTLSAESDFTGGGTYFPTAKSSVAADGVLIRPPAGYCLVHRGARRCVSPAARGVGQA